MLKLAFEKRSIAESETPELFFECVRGEGSFLLESGGSGRYSYIGYDPFWVCTSVGGVTNLQRRRDFLEWSKHSGKEMIEGDALDALQGFLKRASFRGSAPVPFFGGACGYFSYDYGVAMMGLHQTTFDDLHLEDFVFNFVDQVVAFDHLQNEIYFLALAETDIKAREKVRSMQEKFSSKNIQHFSSLQLAGEMGKLQSNLTFEKYQKKLAGIHKLLLDGETYQVNFSQRFSADATVDSWQVYKKLFALNPSPFSCYFEFADFEIMSASPELLLLKDGLHVETWPIKGTVARGKNAKEDAAQIKKLLASEKDEAELSMIVDLERNDVGKVCEVGSVKVKAHRDIEKYSHVIHTVSRVEGRLARGKDFFDGFKALFPGGSITGCPKRRTIEIIDQLEDFKRGVYTGSAGFINFQGDGVMNILIRTMLKKDERIYFQAGGGIVADSDPQKEYEESLNKAKALIASL